MEIPADVDGADEDEEEGVWVLGWIDEDQWTGLANQREVANKGKKGDKRHFIIIWLTKGPSIYAKA